MDPTTAIAEAMRRRSMLGASGAGIPGGMVASNNPSPTNPIAAMAAANPQTPSQLPQGTGTPAGSSPSSGAISALGQAKPGEAEMIVKALIDRLKDHPIPGQPPMQ